MKHLAFTLGLAALTGCGDSPLAPAVGETFVLSIGQSATVAGRGILITFEDVPEDSRCPSDVVCVQAGNARLAIRVSSSDRTEDLEVHTSEPSSVVIATDLELTLQELVPYPVSSHPINKDNYRASLVVLERLVSE